MEKISYFDVRIKLSGTNASISIYKKGVSKELAMFITNEIFACGNSFTKEDFSGYIIFNNSIDMTKFLSLKIQSVKSFIPSSSVIFTSGRLLSRG